MASRAIAWQNELVHVATAVQVSWAIVLAQFAGGADAEELVTFSAATSCGILDMHVTVAFEQSVASICEAVQQEQQQQLEQLLSPESHWQWIRFEVPQDGSTSETISCTLRAGSAVLQMASYEGVEPSQLAQGCFRQLQHLLYQLHRLNDLTPPLKDLELISEQDVRLILDMNAAEPAEISASLVHEIITDVMIQRKHALAVCAWDGELTYGQLDALSNRLAHRLAAAGIRPGSIVPLCFEKSMWTPVAQLGVMRAGAASVLLDVATQPEERLRTIVQQTQPTVLLSSTTQLSLASALAGGARVFEIASECKALASDGVEHVPARATPGHPICIVFSSGTTGTPKGSVLSHSNWSTALPLHTSLLGINAESRVFDFASYSFDMAWSNFFMALYSGSCLCIPSEHERQNNVVEALSRYRATYSLFTPSLATSLDFSTAQDLQVMSLGGEALTRNTKVSLPHGCELYSLMGPSECTAVTLSVDLRRETNLKGALGMPVANRLWIVSQHNPDQLCPFMCTGELYVEGPTVGLGYLSDETKTSRAFLTRAPPWLPKSARLPIYRSGDLVRYRHDGSLEFVGRKDSQAKIRGQRVDFGEVEFHVEACMRRHAQLSQASMVLVDIVYRSKARVACLVAFMESEINKTNGSASQILPDQLSNRLCDELAHLLPAYMVPSEYIALKGFPTTASGKVDRRCLREIGATILDSQTFQIARDSPITPNERQLCSLWATVLGIPEDIIGRSASFLHLGGDSIGAMRLVALARDNSIELSVADILRNPRLCDQAERVAPYFEVPHAITIAAYALMPKGSCVEDLRHDAAALCGVSPDRICDLFPSTPLQQGLMALSAQRSGDYVGRFTLLLPPNLDRLAFCQAWRAGTDLLPILRTRLVDLGDIGITQVVLDKAGVCEVYDTERIGPPAQPQMGLGDELSRACLLLDPGQNIFVLQIHHALYDAWTLPIILRTVERVYLGLSHIPTVPFTSFLRNIRAATTDQNAAFWTEQLRGSDEAVAFPSLPSAGYQPQVNASFEWKIDDLAHGLEGHTLTTAVRATWSLLQSRFTGEDHVVFGAVQSGRQSAIPGVDRIAGPLIATVPIHAHVDWDVEVLDLLRQMQDQAINMIPFEQVGLQNIAKLSDEARHACGFQVLLVVQPVVEQEQYSLFCNAPNAGTVLQGSDAANTYAVMLEIQLQKCGLKMNIGFDSEVVDLLFVRRMALRFEHVLRQICDPKRSHTILSQLSVTSQHDLADSWKLNAQIPAKYDECVHVVLETTMATDPDALAIHAWDGKVTYKRLDELSTSLSHELVGEWGVRPGDVVPLCFEKSMWTPVAVLAVVKAGATFVALDKNHPADRLQSIVAQIRPNMIITSPCNMELAARLLDHRQILVVGPDHAWDKAATHEHSLPIVDSSSTLYITFTSGSTGVPKGVAISHANFSSALGHQTSALGFDQRVRYFDFAPYAFDTAWAAIFVTFAAGACLCTPSEDAMSDLGRAMRDLDVNYAGMTPTMARLLSPELLPDLKTLVLGGEAVRRADVDRWPSRVRLINCYGPSECTPTATVNIITDRQHHDPHIGTPRGLCAWVVNPRNSELSAVGEVGELWLEGPLVGQGYYNDTEKTAAAFVKSPKWLLRGTKSTSGRQGRLYQTGDLVKRRSDGALTFVGRKDSQVKIRGQRVELAEVECQVSRFLSCNKDAQVIAEVLRLKGESKDSLVAFIIPTLHDETQPKSTEQIQVVVNSMTDSIDEKLATVVPAYMLPSFYIGLYEVPRTITGKIDRRELRRIGTSLAVEDLKSKLSASQSKVMPTTGAQSQLREMWAKVLRIPPSEIGGKDSFLRHGGDSVSAMRLSALARRQGLNLSVVQIMKYPRLDEMAHHM